MKEVKCIVFQCSKKSLVIYAANRPIYCYIKEEITMVLFLLFAGNILWNNTLKIQLKTKLK